MEALITCFVIAPLFIFALHRNADANKYKAKWQEAKKEKGA